MHPATPHEPLRRAYGPPTRPRDTLKRAPTGIGYRDVVARAGSEDGAEVLLGDQSGFGLKVTRWRDRSGWAVNPASPHERQWE
jgi:hypothetical protein